MVARKHHLFRKFGITEEQYDALLRQQDGRCGVCNRSAETFRKRLAVDHDHKSGEIRGLLCIHCNRWVVGRHRRGAGDALLLAAYNYLTRDYPGHTVPPKIKKKKRVRKKSRILHRTRRSRHIRGVPPTGSA